MTVIGETTDHWGRTVQLTDGRWRHILDRHVELADQMANILSTVDRPDRVNFDADYPRRENFYCARSSEGAKRPWYLKVCVEYGTAGGTIITAYPTDRIKRTEQKKWP